MTRSTIIMAGGGTGGHVFPMLAVADALMALEPELRLVFAGTARGMEAKLVPERGYELELLHILPLRGAGMTGALRGGFRAARATLEARRWLQRLAPGAVFSVGGYAAGPVSAAARSLGIPVALLEPNSAIGLANRMIAPFVQRAYTAFGMAERHFAPSAVLRTGVPLRAGFSPRDYRAGDPRTVLVLGGSQGAKSLNEVVPEALSQVRVPLRVVHQCGRAHAEEVRERYERLSPVHPVEVVPFIEDMPTALAGADLVVGRSGASAVSEICAIGRASLLVPYPYAASDHQWHNARALEAAGAALAVRANEVSVARLAADVEQLLGQSDLLVRMAESARGLGRPDAARTIASDLIRLSRKPSALENSKAKSTANRRSKDQPMTFRGTAEVLDV